MHHSIHERALTEIAAQLRDAKALLDDGIFTQQEFEVEKRRLLLARDLVEPPPQAGGGGGVRRGAADGVVGSVVSPPPLKDDLV